jgi:AcrR family transcriptional regulator
VLVAAENAITVSSDEVVQAVQDDRRQDVEGTGDIPRPTELACDKQRRTPFGEDSRPLCSMVCEHVERAQIARVAPRARHEALSQSALQRREIEAPSAIVSEQELHQSAAEPTDSVVKDEVSAFAVESRLRVDFSHALILMNMFTQIVKPRGRGRPPGPTPQGAAAKDRLYGVAVRLIAQRGYEATTLRDIAKEAGVSVGLLYRYFPSKQAVVLTLYDELSADYERQTAGMQPGKWRDRFIFALRTSLGVLDPHRVALRALTPVLVGDPVEGIFAATTAFSRLRVQRVFERAVAGSIDAPKPPLAEALGRLLYLVHLAVLLWWLLDKSSKQRATVALVSLTQQLLPSAALALRVPPVRRFVVSADELIREALFENPVAS